ncbi:MAG: hypothetical protein ABL907_21725 [Hyphomicrobium sp.]
MFTETPRLMQGAQALQWLQEFLNFGIHLSGIVLEEQCRIRLRAHRTIEASMTTEGSLAKEGAMQVLFFQHRVELCLFDAEFMLIDLRGPDFGIFSRAALQEGDKTTLEVWLDGGSFLVAFAAVQLSQEIIPVYGMRQP